ncbi:MAG: dTMP kinase [Dehalococcoidia bacterium]
MSLFISFEGGEGTGKTTQSESLRDRLVESGLRYILVHEPGGTTLGERLRPLIKGELSMSYGSELFLFSAARAELVSNVIKPSLKAGITVISDRYVDSTIAYQGYGRRLNLEHVRAINALATQGIMPDLTVLLDMAPEDALKRLGPLQMGLSLDRSGTGSGVRLDSEGQRKFEEEEIQFHNRVRQGYLKLAKKEPDRWLVVDAGHSVEAVANTIWARVQSMLSKDAAKNSATGRKG